MQIKITTWNVNSVRFRIDLVAKFIKAARPDVLCLQETKCPDDAFPMKRFRRLGYDYAAMNGQKVSRRRHPVAASLRRNEHARILRQDRQPPYHRDARRKSQAEGSADAA
jgi:exonuclease III